MHLISYKEHYYHAYKLNTTIYHIEIMFLWCRVTFVAILYLCDRELKSDARIDQELPISDLFIDDKNTKTFECVMFIAVLKWCHTVMLIIWGPWPVPSQHHNALRYSFRRLHSQKMQWLAKRHRNIYIEYVLRRHIYWIECPSKKRIAILGDRNTARFRTSEKHATRFF